jgi:cytochrome c oxidase subunit 1
MGIVSEILTVNAKKPLFGYSVMVYSTCAIGFLGFGVWAHHMFTVGMSTWAKVFFTTATMLIAIPTGVKILNWIMTLWGGRIRFNTANLFALSFIVMFTIGGLSGIMHSSTPIDTQHQDTYFVVAHFHYVLYGGAVMGLFGGIFHWFPKVTGRLMNESMGKLQFWLYMIGFNLTFFPMHFLGLTGMPRRIFTYANDQGWNFWNSVCTVGAYLTAVGGVVFVINFFWSLRKGKVAGNDPWDARTLEWSIPSPPPLYNFAIEPEVTRLDDFWFQKYTDDGKKKTIAPEPKVDTSKIHMPGPSFWPILLAAGLTTAAGGFFFHENGLIINIAGLLIAVVSAYGWSFEEG